MSKILPLKMLLVVTLVALILSPVVPSTQTMLAAPLNAADPVLESAVLRVEVTLSPYSYKIVEKSTGDVLVSQSETRFSVSNVFTTTVTEASDVTQTATTLDATLILSGTADTAHVQFTFTSPQVVQVVLSHNNGTPTNIREQFYDQGEHYYGLWEYNRFGTSLGLDNRGANRDLLGITNGTNSINPNARAPFYVTSRKYGIYAESEARGHYTIAVSDRTSFDFDTPQLKYHVIYGPLYREVMYRYNSIAGGARMPPLWAFDPIWWRDDHHQDFTRNGVTNAQALVITDTNNLQKYQIPASAVWLDRPYGSGGGGLGGWGNWDFDPGSTGFPDPAAMIADTEAKGMHMLLWITNRANNSMFTEAQSLGYLFNIANGWDRNYTNNPAVDIRNPAAYEWLKSKLDIFVNQGIRGYKIDRGEEGEMPASLQNEMTVLIDKLAFEGMSAAYGDDVFLFARNAYDKSRQYLGGVWNGDTRRTFAGLADTVKMIQRDGAINFPMAGSDTGGYTSGTTTQELWARWFQVSAYHTMMEVLMGSNRTPWNNFDAEVFGIVQKQTRDHHDLIPYTRSSLYAATQTGFPVVRQMIFEFPDDPTLYDYWSEYMFGNQILVAPVTTAGATSRDVYLPAGQWIDYNDKSTTYTGPMTITAAAPLDVIPLYIKAGSIIPRGDILKSNNNWTPNWAPYLRIEFFPAAGVDSSFDYYTGSAVVPITGGVANSLVTLHFGDLGTPGTAEVYVDHFSAVYRNGVRLSLDNGDFQFDFNAKRMTIPFAGETTIQINLAPYDFDGFFSPVDNPPVLNEVKAGSIVPVKFSLNGDQGLSILYPGYPNSEQIACDSAAPVDSVEETAAAGASGFRYDPTEDQYLYAWKTDKAWAKTCRLLSVKLVDGTVHQANFSFK